MHSHLSRDYIQAIGHRHCKVMIVADIQNVYKILSISLQMYCGITPFYGTPAYFYLRLGMGLSISLVLWQQFSESVWKHPYKRKVQNHHGWYHDHINKGTTLWKRSRPFQSVYKIQIENVTSQMPIFQKTI